jgi:NAD(P)-dependent dehydrogenase (short-subunit alcohol dehydrogenase family)
VVNVTSIAGSRVHPFAGAAYATSKAALAALTREMASDFGRVGVRVNAIAPGEIDTSILSRAPRRSCTSRSDGPARHAGRSREDHLRAVHGDEFYVNGAEIHINGGQHV